MRLVERNLKDTNGHQSSTWVGWKYRCGLSFVDLGGLFATVVEKNAGRHYVADLSSMRRDVAAAFVSETAAAPGQGVGIKYSRVSLSLICQTSKCLGGHPLLLRIWL